MNSEQSAQEQQVWRVVAHTRGGGGWWVIAPERYSVRAAAEQAAVRATTEGGCSNAGVYPEVGGVVRLPGWLRVREVRA